MTLLAAVIAAGTAHAVELPIDRIPYERLEEVRSAPGESLETFLLRVGPKLRAYSDATQHEACGAIAQGEDGYGLVIGTSGSHLACAIFWNKLPEGMRSLGVGIHSHGGEAQFRANRSDRLFMGLGDDARSVARTVIYGQELNNFSETDHRNGRGYLATETGVLYYDGQGGTTQVRATTDVNLAAQ